MSTKQNENTQDAVIVEVGPCSQCSVQVKRVHHRDFPEARAECGSVEDAVSHLARMLATHRESAGSDWRRESLDRAINDVKAFGKTLVGGIDDTAEACRCGAHAAPCADPSDLSRARST